ncbi:hypothetical protein SS50377_22467 [Spironucleus salmonicida]|uniref:Uncharacterized protein n=1 Tax=Spironucleus salmonicida TaxID=348837 RepID=V6LC45_9EUKA|nr:hypothetical protein SS50377_22467 [Spironucleus salmonicida]|eukprot:EST42042.1 Hypothetical protein SS50377_18349 [Spironucleus salmonicida]
MDYIKLNKVHKLWMQGKRPKSIQYQLNLTIQEIKQLGNQTNSLEAGALSVLRGIKNNIHLGLTESIEYMIKTYKVPTTYKNLLSLYMDYKDILSSEFIIVNDFASGFPQNPPFLEVSVNGQDPINLPLKEVPWFAVGWWWLDQTKKPKNKELNNFILQHGVSTKQELRQLKLSYDESIQDSDQEEEEEEIDDEGDTQENPVLKSDQERQSRQTISQVKPISTQQSKTLFNEPKQKFTKVLQEQLQQEQIYLHKLIREMSTTDKRIEELKQKINGLNQK